MVALKMIIDVAQVAGEAAERAAMARFDLMICLMSLKSIELGSFVIAFATFETLLRLAESRGSWESKRCGHSATRLGVITKNMNRNATSPLCGEAALFALVAGFQQVVLLVLLEGAMV